MISEAHSAMLRVSSAERRMVGRGTCRRLYPRTSRLFDRGRGLNVEPFFSRRRRTVGLEVVNRLFDGARDEVELAGRGLDEVLLDAVVDHGQQRGEVAGG